MKQHVASASEKIQAANAEFHMCARTMGTGKGGFCAARSSAANFLHEMEGLLDELECPNLRSGWSEVLESHKALFAGGSR